VLANRSSRTTKQIAELITHAEESEFVLLALQATGAGDLR